VVGCDSIITLNLYVGQINGNDMLYQKYTGHYSVLNPANGISYMWYANNGTVFGNNPASSIKAVFDSTANTYITLTATTIGGVVLYRDTIVVSMGVLPNPKLATTGGVGCQLFKDSIADGGGVFYYLDTMCLKN
jgi:hypothetical protein